MGNTLLAKGLEAIERGIRKEPGGADNDCLRSRGDLAWWVLFKSFLEFGGCDEVGGEISLRHEIEDSGRTLELRSVMGEVERSHSSEDGCYRHS
jgi:hypothetical protein